MNIIKDLSLGFRLLPRRIPRLLVTSLFIVLFFLPPLCFAIAADALYSAFAPSASPYSALLSGDTLNLNSKLSAYNASVTDSVQVLNGLPFVSTTYLPESVSLPTEEEFNTLSSRGSFFSDVSTLVPEETLDTTMPIYGPFYRVLTPTYAEYLTHLTGSDPRNQTFAERYSLVLSPDDPVLTPNLTNCTDGPEGTNCASSATENSPLADCADDSEGTDCLVSESVMESVASEKTFDFYVVYYVVGVAPVYHRLDLDTLALVSALSRQPASFPDSSRIEPTQSSLDSEFSRGFYVAPAAASSPVADFASAALRTDSLPVVTFSSAADLLRFASQETTLSPDFTLPYAKTFSKDSSLYMGELNSVALAPEIFRVISILLTVLLSLLSGLLAFLIFNSAKKSFTRRSAPTLSLLHALRATESDCRLLCWPYRLLLLFLPAVLLAIIIYLSLPSFFLFLNSLILPPLISLAGASTPVISFSFSLCIKLALVFYLLAWLLSGLRTRSFSSLQKISKYLTA